MSRSRYPASVLAAVALVAVAAAAVPTGAGGTTAPHPLAAAKTPIGAAQEPSLVPRPVSVQRASVAEDRYAMAGGCYVVRAADGRYVVRSGDAYAATAATAGDATPFFFQATDLGRYLLYDPTRSFVAASEGLLGRAAYAGTRSTPGGIAGGVALEQTDGAADAVARSEANRAAGRGVAVVAAAEPSELADWAVAGAGPFTVTLPATDQALAASGNGSLVLATEGTPFSFELAAGCATFPEIEINVDGPVVGGATSFQEVRGFLEAHLHMMAFEFIGGRVRCGRPWHTYGVAHALVDCPDHEGNGAGAVLEQVLSGFGPHTTDGWPTFTGWPRYNSLTHEQVYYRWLERAWRGGLRLMVNLLVDNRQLCLVYPYKRNSCNEMDGVRLQAQRIRELERYIDAQSGGPGEGWFRIVEDPFTARRVINEGKLAVVLGIEVSVPLDCGLTIEIPHCDPAQVEQRLDEVYELGVRQMELVNKFDNAFSGVTGDAGTTGIVVNQGNRGETGRYWQMETCDEHDGHAHDRPQINAHDSAGPSQRPFLDRDSLVGGILALFGRTGAAPVYPQGPHCNVRALSALGRAMIEGMVERGMIFDPDHMSARARTQAMDLLDELGYSGVISSHSWADDTIYPRVYERGGVVTPYAGGSTGFLAKWRQHRAWADPRYSFGFGFGADTNGFGSQGGPRGANAANKVTYPFTGFGGVTIHPQRSGSRAYDINTDGVAHYGLYPDWIEDVRRQAGADADAFMADMVRGPEAYLQMWERAVGIRPDACRTDVADLTDAELAAVTPGMPADDVLRAVGQPNVRTASEFRYCATDGRTATVSLAPDGAVTGVVVA